MIRQDRGWQRHTWIVCLPAMLLAGCHLLAPELNHVSAPVCLEGEVLLPEPASCGSSAVEPLAVQVAGPLTLDRLIQIALENHPDLASAYARAETARGAMIQAGLYPNPTLAYQGEEMNNPEDRLGFQGGFINQEIVTARKLRLAQTAATHGVTVASWQAMTKRYDLMTRVRQAYFEMLTAQRELQANEQIVRLTEETLAVAEKTVKAGTGARPDVLRAEVERDQSKIRLVAAQQRSEAAWKLLALAIGWPKLPPTELAGSLDDAAPTFDWCSVATSTLVRSSEVQAAQTGILQMAWSLRRQQAEPVPNINVQTGPVYDFTNDALEANLQIGLKLPVFNKNQGNILAAQAELTRAQQDARLIELRLLERLTEAYQRYQTARQQVDIYQKEILPRAAESLRLVRIGYEAGDAKFDYTTVLQAQQILIQARLAAVQAQGELWKAVTDIAGVVQLDALEMPPAHP